MSITRFQRTQMLLGGNNMEKLRASHIAVFGIGGVGGHASEALVRSGIGSIDLIDSDKVTLTNLNRQIIATEDTIGMSKVDAAAKRFRAINPEISLALFECSFSKDNSSQFDFSAYDYVIDAIDTVSSKIELILCCEKAGTPIISSMGTGNKMNPGMLRVGDIYKTSVCPLARVMRRELKKLGIKALKTVYSEEIPIKPDEESLMDCISFEKPAKKLPPASNSFVPATAGLLIASEVIKDILNIS